MRLRKVVDGNVRNSRKRIPKPPTVAVPTAAGGGFQIKRYHRKNYFESEIAASLRMLEAERKDFMWFRVPDTNMASMIDNRIILVKAPSDFVVVFGGRPYLIECKSQSRNLASYSLKYIRDHQLEYLLKVEECGGRGWFLLNDRSTNPITAHALHPQVVDEWRRSMQSVKWKAIKEVGVELPRFHVDGKARWDLHRLFCMIKVV